MQNETSLNHDHSSQIIKITRWLNYSTVTDFAKFLGLSTSVPRAHAV